MSISEALIALPEVIFENQTKDAKRESINIVANMHNTNS